MRTWKQLTKTILASVMALAMVAGYGMSVSADPAGEQTGGEGKITKIFEVPEGITYGASNFVFTITPVGRVLDDKETLDTSVASTMPELGNDGSYALGVVGELTVPTAAMPGSFLTLGTGYVTQTIISPNVFGSIGGTNKFPHAGVYVYTISEEDLGAPGMTYSKAEYQMVVYVVNDDITTGTLKVDTVGFRQVTDDKGGAVTEGSADPDTALVQPKADPEFTNRYDQLVDLEISKKVEGDYADTTKAFDYTMTLTRPAGQRTEAKTYTGIIVDADGNAVKDGSVVRTVSVSYGGGDLSATASFSLSHGQSVQFKYTEPAPTTGDFVGQTGLPAGTKWIVTEAAAPGYKVAVSGENNGGSFSVTQTLEPNEEVTIPENGDFVLGEGENYADWVNERVDISPTGILLNNLPYILLIVVALAGFTGYIVSKRRKARR